MSKNNGLLLIFPKKDRLIFIFAIIVIYFLTTVSKKAFAFHSDPIGKIRTTNILAPKDTLFKDDFEWGQLSGWKQTEDWEASSSEKISGLFSLKHLAKEVAGSSSLFHTIGVNGHQFDIEWSFKLKNGSWDPSGSNRFWVYLGADTTLTDLINGWAVGINLKDNSDLLELWRTREGKPDSLVIQSTLDWNASTLAILHVKRSSQGNWELTYTVAGEPTSPVFSGKDPTFAYFKNMGLFFHYTYTRSGQLWMDDISVTTSPSAVFIQKLALMNSHTLRLAFSKPIQASSLQNHHFQLIDENNLPIPILSVAPVVESNQVIELQLGKITGTQLSLNASGVTDPTGVAMNPQTVSFPLSYSPEMGSVLINEVLFNPKTGGVDFVELVNVSEVPIPVHRLKLATRNDTLALDKVYTLSDSVSYIKPGHYLTCTKDPQKVIPFYISNDPETFCTMSSFPTYLDDAGTVVLLNDSLQVIDELSYLEQMHSTFLADQNGVSLERISFNKPTSERSNWTSASSASGNATPGLPNSQMDTGTETADELVTEPVVFSPNGDGFNDQLTIRYNLGKAGYIANVRIFDIAGRQVNILVKNELLSQQGLWTWKGDSDSNQRLQLGVYIVLVELFDSDGHVKTFKKTCTLTDGLR